MSRFKDIDAPIIVTVYDEEGKPQKMVTTIAELLENTVEVLEEDLLRCKDCKAWGEIDQNETLDGYRYCGIEDGYRDKNFYCRDGKRKADG